jgi:hypothetical protein
MHALQFVLTFGLYVGVPGLQGTDSGPRVHLGRGNEPADVGPTLQHSTRLSTFCLAVEAIAFIFMSLAVQGLKKK